MHLATCSVCLFYYCGILLLVHTVLNDKKFRKKRGGGAGEGEETPFYDMPPIKETSQKGLFAPLPHNVQ